MLYPQNGDRIVTIDSVTSFHPMYSTYERCAATFPYLLQDHDKAMSVEDGLMLAYYCQVYDSRHLQADCQEPGSAPESCARQSSKGYLYLPTKGSLKRIHNAKKHSHKKIQQKMTKTRKTSVKVIR